MVMDTFASQGIEVNREVGTSAGDFNEREWQAFHICTYGAEGNKVQWGPGKEDFFYTQMVNPRTTEAKSTLHLTPLPVIKAVYVDKQGNVKLTDSTMSILKGIIQTEAGWITEASEEIGDTARGIEGTLDAKSMVLDYHTGKMRGLKFDKARAMLGNLANELENGLRGYATTPDGTRGNLLTEPYEIKWYAVETQLRRYWNAPETGKITSYIKKLESLGLKGKTNDALDNKLLPKFLWDGFDSKVRSEKMNLVKDNFYHNIAQIYMSDYLNTVGINQLLHGNENKLFKDGVDKVKRNSFNNASFVSMAFSYASPNLGIEHPLTHFHHIMIAEPKMQDIDRGDAQMYCTEKAYRNMLFGFGKLTKVQADILNELKEGNEVSSERIFNAGGLVDRGGAFISLKNVFFDGSTGLKCSVFPLFKEHTSIKVDGRWVPDPRRGDFHILREKMEGFENSVDEYGNPRNTITFAHFPSAAKTIKKNVATSVNAINDSHFEKKDAKYMGLQVENPSNKLIITDPTTSKQILLSEQDTSTPVNFMGKDTTVGTVMTAYMNDTAQRMTNNYNGAIGELFTFENALMELSKSADAGQVTPTLGKFFDHVRKTGEATGMDSHTLEMLRTENGQPVYNINFPSLLSKGTQIFLNYFSSGVMSEKVPGLTLTVVSDWNTRICRQVHELDADGQPVSGKWTVIPDAEYKSNFRKYRNAATFYDVKNRTFAGLKKGDYIIDDLRASVPMYDENDNIVGYYNEGVRPAHYKEEVSGIPENLQFGHSVRIPVSGHNSATVVKYVNTLSGVFGSICIHAAEEINRKGKDCDLDKEFVNIFDTYTNNKGQRILYGTATTQEGQFNEFVGYQKSKNKVFKRAFKENLDSDDNYKKATANVAKYQSLARAIDDLYEKKYPSEKAIKEGIGINISISKLIDSFLASKDIDSDLEESSLMHDWDTALQQLDKKEYRAEVINKYENELEQIKQAITRVKDIESMWTIQTLKETNLPSTKTEFIQKGGAEKLNNGVLNNRILHAKMVLSGNTYIANEDGVGTEPTGVTLIKNLVDKDNFDAPGNLIKIFQDIKNDETIPAEDKIGIDNLLTLLKGEDESVDVYTLDGKGVGYINNKGGQRSVGAAINALFNSSILNQFSVPLREGFVTFNDKEYTTFAGNYTENGERKSSIQSALANTMTDNAKERIAAKLGLSIEGVGVMGIMVAEGLNKQDAALYIIQPAVREYFNRMVTLSGSLKTPAERAMVKSAVLSNMIDSYKNKGAQYQNLTTKDLIKNAASGGKYGDIQLSALLDIQAFKKHSDAMFDLNKVMTTTQGLPVSWDDMDTKEEALNALGIVNGKPVANEEFKNLPIPIDVRAIFTNEHPIYKTLIDQFTQVKNLAPAIFLQRTDLFRRMKDVIIGNMEIRRQQMEEFDRTLTNDIISFISIVAYKHWLKSKGMEGTLSTLNHGLIYESARGANQQGIITMINEARKEFKGKNKNYFLSNFIKLY
jgi:hypothetical protein